MVIDNQYDQEDIYGATSFLKWGDNHLYTTKSYEQLKSPPGRNLPRYVP
jgi:hypothetical protein